MVQKRPIGDKCSGSTAAVVWCLLTTEETEARLVAADGLAVQWWFKESWLVVGQVGEMAAVC